MSIRSSSKHTDPNGLEALALVHGGYFDRGDAHAHGIGDRLLHHYVRSGRFDRIYPGVYRLRIAPVAGHDGLLRAWVWSNYRGAISHESALELYGLADVMPSRVQLTVPPSFGRRSTDYDLHRAELSEAQTMLYDGVRATTPARSIVDAASFGTGPEQIDMAVIQAIERALVSPGMLRAAAQRPYYRYRQTVLPLIERVLCHASP